MHDKYASEILDKYRQGNCTKEEVLLIKKWFLDFEAEEAHFSEVQLKDIQTIMWAAIEPHTQPLKTSSSYRWKLNAAAIFVLISLAVFWGVRYQKSSLKNHVTLQTKDLLPGSDKAILIYSNGEQRILAGKIYKAGKESGDGDEQTAGYNTIITPKGGQYQVILPDGTKVWLNAASSLKYRASFGGQKQRMVELTGEAYFEVAHNKEQPFKINTGYQEIEVLGTHFNVNSYIDESAIVTTLMSGRIKISGKEGGVAILKPGQQALLSKTTSLPQLSAVDTTSALAWKNGFFQFKRADLKTVMRQISRWYDVEVAYENKIPEKTFTGKVYRNLKLSEALEILSYYDVHFKVNGKKINISN